MSFTIGCFVMCALTDFPKGFGLLYVFHGNASARASPSDGRQIHSELLCHSTRGGGGLRAPEVSWSIEAASGCLPRVVATAVSANCIDGSWNASS